MEINQILIVEYSQSGHYAYPEDTFSERIIIENSKQLSSFFKKMYKLSASSFSNYPFSGLFNTNSISFFSQKIIEFEGEKYYSEIKDCEPPVYFNECCLNFNTFTETLKTRLPKLREIKENKLKEAKEKEL